MSETKKCLHSEEMDTDSKIIMNLRKLWHIIRFSHEGKDSQDRILLMLMRSGGMTQKQLAERMDIRPGSASEVLTKLENAGLITRTENSEDRRNVDIVLNDDGLARAQMAARQREAHRAEMLSVLTEDEKDTLLTILEKLNSNWRDKYGNGYGQGRCCGHKRSDD